MQKKLMMVLLSVFSLAVAAKADVTETISQLTYVEETPQPVKERKQADSFYYIGVQGGATFIDGADPVFSAVFGYKHRIGKTKFMFGGQLTAGHDTWGDGTGLFIDVAPTISYINFPGGYYNSFEVTFGLGLGYKQNPSDTFAFTPELNLGYWFNWFGVGVDLRYSIQTDYEEGDSYYYEGNQYIWSYTESGNNFAATLRFSVRF